MGATTDMERLMEAYRITAEAAERAEAVAKDAKRGTVWKPLVSAVLTFVGALGGGAFAAGRYFEHASALVEAHEKRLLDLETHQERDHNHLAEAWEVAIAAKGGVDTERNRMDAHLNVRTER